MFQKLQSRLTGRMVFFLFAAPNAVYVTMLSYSIPKLMNYSGGLPLFDMSPFGYSYQDAFALLTALGEQGRHVYLSFQLVLDLFYPILFGLCYFCLSQWLVKVGKLTSRFWLILSVVPLFVSLFDYAENIGIWLMLTEYPALTERLVRASSLLTLTKSVLTMVYFTGLISSLGAISIRWFSKRTKGVAS